MTGAAVGGVAVDYTTARFRNIVLNTVSPGVGDGSNGDVWMVYV
jgi:hypothetical protein